MTVKNISMTITSQDAQPIILMSLLNNVLFANFMDFLHNRKVYHQSEIFIVKFHKSESWVKISYDVYQSDSD